MENEKEIRLSIEEFEAVLKKSKLVTSKEAVYEAHIEPGELVTTGRLEYYETLKAELAERIK